MGAVSKDWVGKTGLFCTGAVWVTVAAASQEEHKRERKRQGQIPQGMATCVRLLRTHLQPPKCRPSHLFPPFWFWAACPGNMGNTHTPVLW